MANSDAITYSTSVTEQINTEWISAQVGETAKAIALAPAITDVADLSNQSTKTAAWTYAEALTASALSNEYDATSNTEFTLAEATATAAEYTVAVEIGDLASSSTVSDINAAAANEMARALADVVDSTTLALLNGFTANSQGVGSTGVVQTISNCYLAITNLGANAPGLAERAVFVMHPNTIFQLQNEALTGSGVGIAQVLSREAVANIFGEMPSDSTLGSMAGSIGGLPIFRSTNVSLQNANADHADGLITVGGINAAIGTAVKWMPRIEMARSVLTGRMATRMLGSVAFAVAEKRDIFGVRILSKATTS